MGRGLNPGPVCRKPPPAGVPREGRWLCLGSPGLLGRVGDSSLVPAEVLGGAVCVCSGPCMKLWPIRVSPTWGAGCLEPSRENGCSNTNASSKGLCQLPSAYGHQGHSGLGLGPRRARWGGRQQRFCRGSNGNQPLALDGGSGFAMCKEAGLKHCTSVSPPLKGRISDVCVPACGCWRGQGTLGRG